MSIFKKSKKFKKVKRLKQIIKEQDKEIVRLESTLIVKQQNIDRIRDMLEKV